MNKIKLFDSTFFANELAIFYPSTVYMFFQHFDRKKTFQNTYGLDNYDFFKIEY